MPKLTSSAKKTQTMSLQRLGWMYYNAVQFIHDNGLGEKYREVMDAKGQEIRDKRRRKQNGN